MMTKMKMKFIVFFALVLLFQQINCEIKEIKDIGCQNWTEFLQNQKMIEVTEPNLYRLQKIVTNIDRFDFPVEKGEYYSIFVGNDPVTVWMDLKQNNVYLGNPITQVHPYPQIFFQYFGRPDCQHQEEANEANVHGRFKSISSCLPQPVPCTLFYQDKYVPVTMWSKGGPVEVTELFRPENGNIFFSKQIPLKLYLPENQMKEFTAAGPCKQTQWLNTTFSTYDYSKLKSTPNEVFKKKNGISSVRLRNDSDTVVWVEIKDTAPEHYVIIQLEYGHQSVEEDIVIGLEANGLQPVSYDLETKSTEIINGVKIYLKKVFCVGSYNFIGHIRYIFNVKSSGTNKYNFTATFYDANDANIQLKYFEEEKYGIPKPYPEPYQFEFFTISIVPVTTTTTTTTSTTTTTTTATTPTTTKTSSTSTSSSTTPLTTKNIPNGNDETSSEIPILPSPDASTIFPTKKMNSNEIDQTSPSAAEIRGFFLPVLVEILMAKKLFFLFL